MCDGHPTLLIFVGLCEGLESYFDPNDNWFEGMKVRIQEAVGPLQESLETAQERVQFSTETINYLKSELSLKAGDLAERIARITELESRDVSRVEALRIKGPSQLLLRSTDSDDHRLTARFSNTDAALEDLRCVQITTDATLQN